MPSTPYQVGETVDITLRGAVIRDIGNNYLDIETADGEEMCIVSSADGTEVTRRGPAGGVQPRDVWEDSRGNTWFAILHEHRYGEDAVRLTRDGTNTYPVEAVHQDYILVKRLFRAEPEPGQVEPAPATPVRLADLAEFAAAGEAVHVSCPDWRDGEPVRLHTVTAHGYNVPEGYVGVRYSFVGDDGNDRYETDVVSAAALVTPYGGAE